MQLQGNDYNFLLDDHSETATVSKGITSAIQSYLIKAVYEVALNEISKQIQVVPYVHIMLDEISNI